MQGCCKNEGIRGFFYHYSNILLWASCHAFLPFWFVATIIGLSFLITFAIVDVFIIKENGFKYLQSFGLQLPKEEELKAIKNLELSKIFVNNQ